MQKTAEAVAIGHPDKVCDQISDALLDAYLAQDALARVAIETFGARGHIIVAGEVTANAEVNIPEIVTRTYRECGYDDDVVVTLNVVGQSREIGGGVDDGGAGDQGIAVGYACADTPELMPLEVMLARKLVRAMGKGDGKAQVTVEDGRVVSFVTSECAPTKEGHASLVRAIEEEIVPLLADGRTREDAWLANPNGEWTVGGFRADTGLTGRKLAVDAYGPNVPVGGGAFSGKDATKVDRSAAYMARKIAVDYLRRRAAREVVVHLAYAIGRAEPQMAVVSIDGTQEQVEGYDLTPNGIIAALDLRAPMFRETAKYGHFGNGFAWDK